jgi:scyllo-inositol 2-dehydrogenase (NAD+)
VRRINAAVIGVGWIGEIRAQACVASHLVDQLYIAEIDEEKGRRVAKATDATLTTDYTELLKKPDIEAVIVSTTPETTHYPIARDVLLAGKHLLLEKPMGIHLKEADELIAIAKEKNLKFTVGYTQRFNPRYAYVKQCLQDGTLGEPVTALVNRAVSRTVGDMIGRRGNLGPAQMEATHDIDFVLWCMEHARPKRVFAQSVYRIFEDTHGIPDGTWIIVNMDDGTAFTVGATWVLPPGARHFSSASIEFIGTEGAIQVDDTHKDLILRSMKNGMTFPLSTMPGEQVSHVFQGPMQAETVYFLECVAGDRPVLVTPEQARRVMEVTIAADLSAERGEPIDLPLE